MWQQSGSTYIVQMTDRDNEVENCENERRNLICFSQRFTSFTQASLLTKGRELFDLFL